MGLRNLHWPKAQLNDKGELTPDVKANWQQAGFFLSHRSFCSFSVEQNLDPVFIIERLRLVDALEPESMLDRAADRIGDHIAFPERAWKKSDELFLRAAGRLESRVASEGISETAGKRERLLQRVHVIASRLPGQEVAKEPGKGRQHSATIAIAGALEKHAREHGDLEMFVETLEASRQFTAYAVHRHAERKARLEEGVRRQAGTR